MFVALLEILEILLPILVCVSIGFTWGRRGGVYDAALASSLIANIGAPCLVFSELASLDIEPSGLARMVIGALAAMAISALIGALVLRALRLPLHTFLSPMIFNNSGNMGLPLCLFAFGPGGLTLATGFFATVSLAHFTAGLWIWRGRASLAELLRTPLTYAVLLASAVLATDYDVPRWLQNTTGLLGGLTIPLMLLSLGVSLSRMRIHGVGRAIGLSVLRLGMGFLVGVGLSVAMGLEGIERGVLILQCSMPVAVFNYIFAQRYGRSPAEVASLVVLSTLLSFVTLPLLLAWLI